MALMPPSLSETPLSSAELRIVASFVCYLYSLVVTSPMCTSLLKTLYLIDASESIRWRIYRFNVCIYIHTYVCINSDSYVYLGYLGVPIA